MREIKFRVWDAKLKIMGTPVAIANSVMSECKSLCNEKYLMQFTGLRDKNGKEVFEGDVVSITNPLCQIQKARLIGVVGFSWAAFHVEIKRTIEWELYNVDAPELMFLMNIANSKEIAVIGNIYETPELLTK